MTIGSHNTEGFCTAKEGTSIVHRTIGWEHLLSVHHKGSGKSKLNTTKINRSSRPKNCLMNIIDVRRRNTNDQELFEKMCKNLGHQGNVWQKSQWLWSRNSSKCCKDVEEDEPFCTVGESLGQSSHLVSVQVPQKTEMRTTMRPNYSVTLAIQMKNSTDSLQREFTQHSCTLCDSWELKRA